MLDYIICEGHSASLLATAVKSQIVIGFIPIGGVAAIILRESQYPIFFQAMVKEDRKLFAEKLKAAQRRGLTLDEVIANTLNETLEEANAEEG